MARFKYEENACIPHELFSNLMKKKIVFLTSYFSILPLIILLLILSSLYLLNEKNGGTVAQASPIQYQALPEIKAETQISLQQEDARIKALRDFFQKYNSDLHAYAQTFVESADKYSLDYSLLPAIAMQESNLCKKAPKNSFNCWGFGIYGGKVLRFASYDEAIRTVSKSLGREYKAHGLEGPNEIVGKYTPSDNGTWVKSVSFFMDNIKNSLN